MPRFKIRNYVNSVKLDGTSSFLVKASPSGINNGTNGSVTVSGWVKLDSAVLGTFAELHVNGATSPAFGLGSTGGSYFVFSDRVNAANNKIITAAAFNTYIGLNNWVLMTYVLTSTNITVYAGATAILPTSALGTPISAGTISSLFIGKGQTTAQADIQFLQGTIKDFRIFNGALTSTEVSDLYYNGVVPSSIVATYAMSEGSGTTIADSTGSNSMTATSITWSTDVPLAARSAVANRFNITDLPSSILGTNSTTSGLTIPNNAALNPTAAVTIAIWFFVDKENTYYSLFDNSTVGVTDSYFFDYYSTIGFRWYSAIGTIARNITASTGRIRVGQWNFATATYTGSAIYMYVNGSKIPEEITGISGTLGTNSGQLCIMRSWNALAAGALTGNAYRPLVFNVGCTLAEHQEMYYSNGVKMSAALQAGKVLDLAMTEGSGSTIADVSPTGAVATIGAASSWDTGNTPAKIRRLSSVTSTSSLFFDGSTAYVSLGTAGPIAQALTAFTVSAWVKLETNKLQAIVSDTNSAAKHFNFEVLGGTTNGRRPQLVVTTNGTSGTAIANVRLQLRSWYHVLGTYDGATVKMYVNGDLAGSAVATGTAAASTDDMRIGSGINGARFLSGNTNQVKFWTRALSAGEALSVYQGDNSASIRTSIAGEWLMNDGSGSTVADSAGTDTGTITAATWTTDTAYKSRAQIT
jgi:hypothetical protein